MSPITYLAAGSTVALVIMTGLYLDKRDDYAQAIADCNASKLESVAEAEKVVRVTLEAAYANQRAEWVAMYKAKDVALDAAKLSRDMAEAGTAEREAKITQLTMEANVDEIPDSFECLNVYVPWTALDWMQQPGADCLEAGDSRGAGTDQVCSDSGGLDGDYLASEDFSTITYSDSLIIWGRDRDSLEIVNGRLEAIRHLSDTVVEGSN